MPNPESPEGQGSPVTLVEVVPPKRKWTVMVYFNADNNLAEDAVRNLNELLAIGSSPDVQLLALIDLPNIGGKTYVFRPHGLDGEPRPPRIRKLKEKLDAGDSNLLTAFLKWGVREFPAEHHCVIIWGHGAGWDEFDECRIETRRRAVGPSLRAAISMLVNGKRSRLLATARLTVEDFQSIGLVRRTDFLNNFELKRAFEEAAADARTRHGEAWKFRILGFDSCLMGMAEVAGQVKANVQYIVAAESEIPKESWPYTAILEELHANPEMEPKEFASVIVDEYVDRFEQDDEFDDFPITLSALDLGRYDPFTKAISKLREALMAPLEGPTADPIAEYAIYESLRSAQSFFATSYVDIFDFCRKLRVLERFVPELRALEPLDSDEEARQFEVFVDHMEAMAKACKGVMDAIDGENGFVFYERHSDGAENSHGVSIYFPSLSRCYEALDFSVATEWHVLLQKLAHGAFGETNASDGSQQQEQSPQPAEPRNRGRGRGAR